MLSESYKKILNIHVLKGIELQARNDEGDKIDLDLDLLVLLSGQIQTTNLILNDILHVLEENSQKNNFS